VIAIPWIIRKIIICGVKNPFRVMMPVSTGLNPAIACYAAACALSLLGTASVKLTAVGLVCKLFQQVYTFFIIAERVNTRDRLIRVTGVLFLSMALVSADAIFQKITGRDFIRGYGLFGDEGSVQASFGNPNSLGSWISMVFPLAACFAFFPWPAHALLLRISGRTRLFGKMLLCVLAAALFVSLLFTASRGAWAAVFIAILIISAAKKNWKVFFGMLLFIAVALSVNAESRTYVNVFFNRNDAAIPIRKVIWKEAVRVFADHPVTGSGMNTYSIVAPRYIKETGWNSGGYPHNSYLQLAAETGILGLGSFMALIAVFAATVHRRLKIIPDGWRSGLLMSFASALAGFFFHSFFDNNIFSLQLAGMMWGFLGMSAAVWNMKTGEA
jgi:O-antigen ligase